MESAGVPTPGTQASGPETGDKGMILGSTPNKLLYTAEVPVLVVRANK